MAQPAGIDVHLGLSQSSTNFALSGETPDPPPSSLTVQTGREVDPEEPGLAQAQPSRLRTTSGPGAQTPRRRGRRFEGDHARARERTQQFPAACAGGDGKALLAVLADDVVVWTDGGGRAKAAPKPVMGAAKARGS